MAGSKLRISVCGLAFGLATLVTSLAFADPPGRVARLSFTGGAVSFRPASVDDWTDALLNYPVTTGDHLWVDHGGRAELQIGTTAVRAAASTELSLLTLDDRNLQLRLTQGSIAARVRSLGDEESIEIDTPNGSIDLLRPGFYRVDVNESGDQTIVTVRSGEAEATAPGTAFTVHAESGAVLQGVDVTQVRPRALGPTDAFEDWCLTRDRRTDTARAVRYVSPAMIGYEDLDEYGTWQVVAEYGSIWVPRTHSGWVPYREGRWVWIDPWGWTWIDDAPWGFAPFHYGRWISQPTGWAWVPGTIVARPVYAPALVAFVGGSGWHVSLSINEPVAWFPLAPREPYIPVYRVSPDYVRAVNVTQVNVTNVNVTNITNITYVNRSVPGAVTAVPRQAFVQARPVAAVAVAVPRATIAQAPVTGTAALVVPERTSVVARVSPRVVAPPASVVERTVVVRRTPPAAAVPFETKQVILQQHPGVPLDAEAIQRLHAQEPAKVEQHPLVRAAAPTPAAPRTTNELAVRHSRERADLEARQASERQAVLKRHEQVESQTRTEPERARVRQENEKENQRIDDRHRKEREDLQKRQDSESKRTHSGSEDR
ncbi:MAG TPA: DUF6600 domain-containing protein [Vicinamibacterales bacterium]